MIKQITILLLSMLLVIGAAQAQQKSLSATLEVYVFPTDGQDSSQQSVDEGECYEWAVNNVGMDPFDAAKQADAAAQQSDAQKQQASESTRGAGAGGAVKGAAAGAVIGEIANDDASEGAAWGAAIGAVSSRRRARAAEAEAHQQAEAQEQQTVQATEEQVDNFKKAFSVCLEAKDYMVKY